MTSIEVLTENINQARKGKTVCAFFDFDGTLIAGFSPIYVLLEQYRSGDIDRKSLLKIISDIVRHQRGMLDDHGLMEVGASIIAGKSEADFQAFCLSVYQKHLFKRIYPEARKLVDAHRQRGHRIVIASSSPSQIVRDTATELGIDDILSSHYLSVNQLFTGEVAMPVCWGHGKRLAAEEYALANKCKLENAFFYSDSSDDLPLLESVGHPVALNPNSTLSEYARRREWPSMRFNSRQSGLKEVLRSLGVYGSLVGSYFLSLGVSRLAQNPVSGRNFMVSTFAESVKAIIKMDIDLINEHYLQDGKPRVVIFNHQSQADGFIIMKLLGQHFAAIGKDSFVKVPLIGDAYKYAGIIPIDRGDGKSAIASMQPLIDAIQIEGRSVAIAPEGTRSLSRMPGPFKKGAFHLALDAGVEILPVVFHNTVDVQAKGDHLFHPAKVKVEILAPIDTSSWQRENLAQHINDVRALYLQAMGFKPEQEDPPGKGSQNSPVANRD